MFFDTKSYSYKRCLHEYFEDYIEIPASNQQVTKCIHFYSKFCKYSMET